MSPGCLGIPLSEKRTTNTYLSLLLITNLLFMENKKCHLLLLEVRTFFSMVAHQHKKKENEQALPSEVI